MKRERFDLFNAMRPALGIGAGALLLCIIAAIFDPMHFFRAYLFAWLMCLGIALGAMALVMLHHLTGGAWGWLIRRPGEAAAMTLPLLAAGFIPIALGIGQVFPWARPELVAHEALLQRRQPFFSVWFVLLRALIYFALWIALAWRLRQLSLEHDRTGDPALLRRLRRLSAVGFLVYFITMSLAAVDWIASREPDWYSSTFALAVIVGQSASGLAFVLLIMGLLRDTPPLRDIVQPDRTHDLGNLLQTVVVLWAYISFAQYLVIWIGNTQEDILWFYHRTSGGWRFVGISLMALHFGFPFLVLLFQPVKRSAVALAAIAGFVLLMRMVDVLWMVAPSNLGPRPQTVHWLDFVAPIGVGGLWFAGFLWLLKAHPLVPLGHRAASVGGDEPLQSDDEEPEGTTRSPA